MYKKIENPSPKITIGTSYSSLLIDVKYDDLERLFGKPSFPEPSFDGKVQREWVFKDIDNNIFTIYDWKTFSEFTTLNTLKVWNVGSRKFAGDFIDWVQEKLE